MDSLTRYIQLLSGKFLSSFYNVQDANGVSYLFLTFEANQW